MGADYIPVSQVEQGDAADAPPQPASPSPQATAVLEETLTELNLQIRRSSIWVYYMLLVQVIVSFWYPSLFLFFVNLFFSFLGFVGVQNKRRAFLCIHFGYTIGLHCLAWFVVFYTMFYATSFAILALVFCLVQSIGLRHERNLLSLIAVVPVTLETVAVEQQTQQDTENTVPQSEQYQEPQIHYMPAMPSFAYGVYGQQAPSSMEQPLYPGMFPGFYPMPQQQAYFPHPSMQGAYFPFPPSAQMPTFPPTFPVSFAPFLAPQSPVDNNQEAQQ